MNTTGTNEYVTCRRRGNLSIILRHFKLHAIARKRWEHGRGQFTLCNHRNTGVRGSGTGEFSHHASGKESMQPARSEFKQVDQQPVMPTGNRDRLLP